MVGHQDKDKCQFSWQPQDYSMIFFTNFLVFSFKDSGYTHTHKKLWHGFQDSQSFFIIFIFIFFPCGKRNAHSQIKNEKITQLPFQTCTFVCTISSSPLPIAPQKYRQSLFKALEISYFVLLHHIILILWFWITFIFWFSDSDFSVLS